MLKRSIVISVVWIAVLVFPALPGLAEVIVDTAWVRRYNGPGNYHYEDDPSAIVLDDYGNVYVTGVSEGNGTWEDYATIKYYPNGDTAWIRRYNGPGNLYDAALDIAVHSSGNVYVTGTSYAAGGPYGTEFDYLTIKYYPNGDTVWVRRYNREGNGFDHAYAIAVDSSGNAYVTGEVSPSDYGTIKYHANGDTAWIRTYDGMSFLRDEARAIGIDGYGNVYVTGRSQSAAVGYDYATIKYSPDGDTIWVRRYNGSGNGDDEAHAIAVDELGNAYVTGLSSQSSTYPYNYDYTTIKYYPNGDTGWVRRYNGPGNSLDVARAVAVDACANVYVTGISYGDGTQYDYATIKYYANGDTAWIRRYSGPGSSADSARSVAVDVSGNVYVTGTSCGNGPFDDYATVKYYPNGDSAWVKRYNETGEYNDRGRATTVDVSGNVYVTGTSYGGTETRWDYATIMYFQALRGDANRDGVIDVADIMFLINYLFIDGPQPDPLQVGDCNCNEEIDTADLVYLINYLFVGGSPPQCP